MSATNRGAKRIDADNYPTPEWVVHRLLEAVKLPYGEWLEPCAGEGAIVRAIKSYEAKFGHQLCASIMAVELRAECEAKLRSVLTARDFLREGAGLRRVYAGCDYLDVNIERVAVTITNPPYSLAEPIIRKALSHSDVVCMLLRLNFWGGAERTLLDEHPADTYVLPNRPSFVVSSKCVAACGWSELAPVDAPRFASCPECGSKVRSSSSDATEYAWFVWDQRNAGRNAGCITRLASTPIEERRQ